MNDNLSAFDELGFRPITAGQPGQRDLSVTVMGQPASMPVLISPTGVQAVHPDGEVGVARAAAARGVLMGLSSFASKPLTEVIAAQPQTFFQIYWAGDRDSMITRMERAKAAGVCGMILTLDWSFVHSRDWGSPTIPSAIDLKTVVTMAPEVALKPFWLLEWLRVRQTAGDDRAELLGDRWAGAWLLRGVRHVDGHTAAHLGRCRLAALAVGWPVHGEGNWPRRRSSAVRSMPAQAASRCRTTAATTSTVRQHPFGCCRKWSPLWLARWRS